MPFDPTWPSCFHELATWFRLEVPNYQVSHEARRRGRSYAISSLFFCFTKGRIEAPLLPNPLFCVFFLSSQLFPIEPRKKKKEKWKPRRLPRLRDELIARALLRVYFWWVLLMMRFGAEVSVFQSAFFRSPPQSPFLLCVCLFSLKTKKNPKLFQSPYQTPESSSFFCLPLFLLSLCSWVSFSFIRKSPLFLRPSSCFSGSENKWQKNNPSWLKAWATS